MSEWGSNNSVEENSKPDCRNQKTAHGVICPGMKVKTIFTEHPTLTMRTRRMMQGDSNCRQHEMKNGVVLALVEKTKWAVRWPDGIIRHHPENGLSIISEKKVKETKMKQWITHFKDCEKRKKKNRLLEHLRNDTYTELRPSAVHGIGVFAGRPIPKGTNPFLSNNETMQKTIDLTEDDLEQLPDYVSRKIKRFVIPHRRKGMRGRLYAVPEGGLNGIDLSFYANSSLGRGIAPNLELSEEGPDNRGYTTLIASREIGKGEELFWLYPHSGRGGGVVQSEEEEAITSLGAISNGHEIMTRSRLKEKGGAGIERPFQKGTMVKIWLGKEYRWVYGKVMGYVDAKRRSENIKREMANRGMLEAVPDTPIFKKGCYRISYKDKKTEPNVEDYFSDSEDRVVVK
jgi:hypothetical protein